MKQFKTIQDAQKVLNDLYNWIELHRTKNWDFTGLRITNAGDGVDDSDYVTVRQIKKKPEDAPNSYVYRTIVFSKDGQVSDGEESPADVIGQGIEGQPIEVWVLAEPGFEPSGGDLIVNIAWTRYASDGTPTTTNLLATDLHLPSGQSQPAFSSAFTSPVPTIGRGAKLNKVIVTANNAGFVSIGLVMKVGVNVR